jgi:hypothetical protein
VRVRGLPALAAGAALLAALTGCGGPPSPGSAGSAGPAGSAGSAGSAAAPAPIESPAADDFRSVRTYAPVAPPVRLRISAAGVDTALERLGRAPDRSIALPSKPERAGWFAGGPRPGQAGPAVVIGHVDSDSGPAVFVRLAQLDRGDTVLVDRADGSTATFRVTRQQRVAKADFPTAEVYAPDLAPSLRLITCGGSFDRGIGRYRDNVIVYAVPA